MRAHRLWLIALLLTACDSPTVPERLLTSVYDYRLLTPEPLVLRWPLGTTVDIYVQPAIDAARTAALENAVQWGIAAWNDAVLYREVRLQRTTDLQIADAVVMFSNVEAPVELSGCVPSGGVAVTTFCRDVNDPSHLAVFPLRSGSGGQVKILVRIANPATVDVENLRRLVTHELGHVLGLAQHSQRSTDLMFGGALTRSEPSPADRATLQVLYHTRPDITP